MECPHIPSFTAPSLSPSAFPAVLVPRLPPCLLWLPDTCLLSSAEVHLANPSWGCREDLPLGLVGTSVDTGSKDLLMSPRSSFCIISQSCVQTSVVLSPDCDSVTCDLSVQCLFAVSLLICGGRVMGELEGDLLDLGRAFI